MADHNENQSKNTPPPPKVIIDAAIQAGGFERTDGSSQTDSLESKDFHVQVCLQEQSEPMATQTESIPPLAPTIKQEIRMPNLPSSVAQTPVKKRKLSSVSISSTVPRNLAPIDVPLPQQQTKEPANIEPSIAPESISNGSGDHLNSEQAHVDDSILNSDVYKIYCREKDPEEAMKKIKELKNCITFQKSARSFPAEENFKTACETTLDRLWKKDPHLSDSKFDKIKKFVSEDITLSQLTKVGDKPNMGSIFTKCLTWIRMLRPDGYEFWYIANFEKGPTQSKWYRAESTIKFEDCMLARLNVMGLHNTIISKLHYDHLITTNSIKQDWFNFSNELISNNGHHLVDVEGLQSYEKGMLYDIYIHEDFRLRKICDCPNLNPLLSCENLTF